MVEQYRKKPVTIEAIEWTGNNLFDVCAFVGPDCKLTGRTKELLIVTLEGIMTAKIGDYIIKGVKGEFYPCKSDIFEATYEKL